MLSPEQTINAIETVTVRWQDLKLQFGYYSQLNLITVTVRVNCTVLA